MHCFKCGRFESVQVSSERDWVCALVSACACVREHVGRVGVRVHVCVSERVRERVLGISSHRKSPTFSHYDKCCCKSWFNEVLKKFSAFVRPLEQLSDGFADLRPE